MSIPQFLLPLAAYFLGAIPFGLLFSKLLAHRDPRQYGSGNIGATNAMRTGGKLVGALTLAADIGKGSLAVAASMALSDGGWVVAATAIAAFLGHVFPVYLKFKGGKGVATMFGVVLPWMPWVAVAAFCVWLLTLKISRYVSVASITAGISLPLAAWWLDGSLQGVSTCVIFALLMPARHAANIRRLIEGTEPAIGENRKAGLQGR